MLLRLAFKFLLFAILAFAFVVLFESGPDGYAAALQDSAQALIDAIRQGN